MQNELDSTLQRTSAHAKSLQGAVANIQKEREELQFELQQAKSALESHASEREYMQSEASSLQQALHKQTQETQHAQQTCQTWMTNARQQVSEELQMPLSCQVIDKCLKPWCVISPSRQYAAPQCPCSRAFQKPSNAHPQQHSCCRSRS